MKKTQKPRKMDHRTGDNTQNIVASSNLISLRLPKQIDFVSFDRF